MDLPIHGAAEMPARDLFPRRRRKPNPPNLKASVTSARSRPKAIDYHYAGKAVLALDVHNVRHYGPELFWQDRRPLLAGFRSGRSEVARPGVTFKGAPTVSRSYDLEALAHRVGISLRDLERLLVQDGRAWGRTAKRNPGSVIDLTGDRPLTLRDARKLARWWQANGFSASLRKVGPDRFSVKASRAWGEDVVGGYETRGNPSRGWHFSLVAPALDSLSYATADHTYAEAQARDVDGPVPIVQGKRVGWLINSPYVVKVPIDKIDFMEGNLWNPGHAKALLELISCGDKPVFRLPAARLYRIDESDVEGTEADYADGELEYQSNMIRPWEKGDVGSFSVHLVDGNHRALAAMAAGEEWVPVVVGQSYRKDVRPEEWLELEGEDPKWWHRNPGRRTFVREIGPSGS